MGNRRGFFKDVFKFGAGVTLASTLPPLGNLDQVVLASPLEVERYTNQSPWRTNDKQLYWNIELRRAGESLPLVKFNQHITGYFHWVAQPGYEFADPSGYSVVEFAVNSVCRKHDDEKIYVTTHDQMIPLDWPNEREVTK